NEHVESSSDYGAGKRTGYRYPGVGPIGMPFSAYGKYGVGKTRTQIPRRVYGEASRTAQADTNHGDERSDHKWIEPLREAVRSDEEYAHNEDHSADHLADEVIAARPYGGRSTKDS